eukprot:scaffold14663_cov167-Amphora_coffeaeformis.AAC.1
MLGRRKISCFWCCLFCYYWLLSESSSSSLALSASSSSSSSNNPTATATATTTTTLLNERSFSTTRFGMPPADRIIPRWDHPSKPNKKVVLDCQCGRVRVTVPHADIRVDPPPPKKKEKDYSTYHAAVDCHCPSCRKYHVADRASYLLVPADRVEFQEFHVPAGKSSSSSTLAPLPPSPSPESIGTVTSPFLYTFHDSCQHLGPVLRYQCAHCRTKIATQPRPSGDQYQRHHQQQHQQYPYGSDQYFLNLASIRDDSLPKKWAKQWRAFRFPWQYASQCVWTRARAESEYEDDSDSSNSSNSGSDDDTDDDDSSDDDDGQDRGKERFQFQGTPTHRVSGSCACGTYRYQINYPSIKSATTELQHCYCQLCRRLSGGPFQTWMPASREYFTWLPRNGSGDPTSSPPHEPPLHRYTDHGRRHICENCGGVLTIVYDADGDDVVWPAAGGIDDSCLPQTKEEMSKYLYSVCHICCRYRQSWYALPNDGNSRISEAS